MTAREYFETHYVSKNVDVDKAYNEYKVIFATMFLFAEKYVAFERENWIRNYPIPEPSNLKEIEITKDFKII